ncbi:DNA polymerase I [Bartonella krasnovii]|uniref:DNA polymerase I n=1 Tax=Bartonella krasnovii TaxID=2267275 RepID=A0A5B9D3Q8_9HYPH|nr:DNA polymerase I [Bartonella krasnovii]QEE13000.1 DNA polymerase I [Bartonella krasnovii]UNF29119.1 DNA polymerase I [Bartonella krasnovii]UNF35476.1 DNA polymerase I [Bartonella krasnovii]UNF48662.1 DNA polymerase I [Bartonella krasnovii]UNF53688.1 DNA polymerase I [Bartonella krasnovii]
MKATDHLLLVDGSGYVFRAYYALPPLKRKKDGLPIGAVAGFCNMLWKLLCDARNTKTGIIPTHFAVIFDYSSDTFRKQIYPQYKANRSEPPEDLIPQFALIRQATKAFNLPCIEKEGFEADDLIATYATLATKVGAKTTIISSDKDLMQLVNKHVSLYDGMKDKHIGVSEVIEKWGVFPEKMIDLQALIGDATDNVPGIPGIGPKIAAQLLNQFDSLDLLLQRVTEVKQTKRRENIQAYSEQVKISRELVRLKTDVPIDSDLDDFILEPQDGPRLISFLKAMEFSTLTRRVAEATSCDATAIDALDIAVDWEKSKKEHDSNVKEEDSTLPHNFSENSPQQLAEKRKDQALTQKITRDAYTTILDEGVLQEWLWQAEEQGFFAFDTETTSLDPMQAKLVGFSLALQPEKAAYIPLEHVEGEDDLLGGARIAEQIKTEKALALLKPILEDSAVLKIGQNIKYDWLVMKQYGIVMRCFDDTMLFSYALDAGTLTHNMDDLSKRWLGHTPIAYKDLTHNGKKITSFAQVDLKQATLYAAEDADVTLRLWQVLKPQLVSQGMTKIYERLDKPLIDVLARMEERGILIDKKILLRLSGELAQAAALLEEEIYQLADEKFNLASPKQLGDILFGKMGLPGGAKTKGGQWSTSAQTLEELAAEGHILPRKIIDWRQLTKLKSTYTDALPSYILPKTGRVHTNYSLATTSTGRLSSSEPNLQNIPVRTVEGRKIRTAFIAPKGHVLLSADYSQIELRILAHIADIKALKEAFAKGHDIHAITASEMFGVAIEGMPSDTRRRAKAINFGIIYGISAFGLANQLGISRQEAGRYIQLYFERFPGIKDYMEKTKSFARENGYVETIFGRRIHYPEIKAKNVKIRSLNERAAINAPIQGSAADIIRRAMIQMEDALKEKNLSAKMLLQVHDELIFEVPEEESKKTMDVVKNVMENATMPVLSLSVPLEVKVMTAQNWDEAH